MRGFWVFVFILLEICVELNAYPPPHHIPQPDKYKEKVERAPGRVDMERIPPLDDVQKLISSLIDAAKDIQIDDINAHGTGLEALIQSLEGEHSDPVISPGIRNKEFKKKTTSSVPK